MSICYLLDGVTPPARQNGKSLPCERLQAENDKLREQGERLFDKTLELATENDKLRGLMRELLTDPDAWDYDYLKYRMCELGVEV